MKEHKHVGSDFALQVAKVVHCTDVIYGHLVVIVQFTPVGVLTIKQAVSAAADAANGRLKVADTLRLSQVPHRPVCLQVLDALCFQLNKLVEKLPKNVLPSEQAYLAVNFSHLLLANKCKRSTTFVIWKRYVLPCEMSSSSSTDSRSD